MAGSSAIVDYASGVRLSTDGMSSVQRCLSDDSITELRSCGQVENGTPSTSPPYWDTDDDDDDCGPKPSALYGKFTWKIESFSQINKRELRSNAFEVGGYKWYILIYPQGCDVCNHLSLFLCVANHDKLLPGWSHFAQFTIAVVNKDPKKSKYSDTLHRFWKKEHDWGWKKFMELSKVADGFINDESLVIKAQVQVIREKAHRPFRCLDCQYRRELVRVYLSNVEQICRRFIEDRRGKLNKLIEDKVWWSSFRAFWLGIDQISRRRMSRDKTDAILKVVVKHFFVEKEVTSTLVMDSLNSGLKALECQSKNKKGKIKLGEMEELPAPMIHVEKDMFLLADDVLLLLERVALEPLPLQTSTPKDDKGSLSRTKDGNSGEEFNKDSIERDERRLTELGRRTLEFFVLNLIFSRIEVAYQEAVALKRQEELIREEEAAEQAEHELKAKRSDAEKERRTKKKQAKQRRNIRKAKDRTRDEKSDTLMQDKHQQQSPSDECLLEEFSPKQDLLVIKKIGTPENASDMSDTEDDVDVAGTIRTDLEDRDFSPGNWDTDTSEVHPAMEASSGELQTGQPEKRTTFVMDDSSSTCSSDSIPPVVMDGSFKGNLLLNNRSQTSPNRGKNLQGKDTQNQPLDASNLSGATGGCRAPRPEPEAVFSLNDRIQLLEQHPAEKEEEVSLPKKLNVKDQVDVEQPSNSRTSELSFPLVSPAKPPDVLLQQPKLSSENASVSATTRLSSITVEPAPVKEPPSTSPALSGKLVPQATRCPQISTSRSEVQKQTIPTKSTMGQATQQATPMSRPSSAPLIPAPRPTAPIVSSVQMAPLLSRSVSAAGRLGTDPSPSALSFVPHSYRNAIMGKNAMGASLAGLTHPSLTPSSLAFESSAPTLPTQTTVRKDQASGRPGLTFGSMKMEALQSQHQTRNDCSHIESGSSSSAGLYHPNIVAGIKQLDIHGESRTRKQYSGGVPSNVISFPAQGMVVDEFPHLDIINDLLDEEKSIGKAAGNLHYHHAHHNHHHSFSQQYSFPCDADIGSFSSRGRFDQTEQYYDEVGCQRVYGSSSSSPLHGHYSQMDLSAYVNGQFEAIQNQWPYGHPTDLSMLSLGNADAGGYSYQLPDYSSGVNGYMYHRPGNGL